MSGVDRACQKFWAQRLTSEFLEDGDPKLFALATPSEFVSRIALTANAQPQIVV
jgi:hypothetical protein